MELTLSVVSYHRFTSDLEAQKTLVFNGKSQVYVVGRSEQCDWCLPDPDRVISGRHALVKKRGNEIAIIDVSTNGVFINRSVEPLGKENNHILSDGDFIVFGDYEIEVSLNGMGLTPTDKQRDAVRVKSQQELLAEEDKASHDDWNFGIPTSRLNKVSSVENNNFAQKPDAEMPLPVFMGNLEDSFVAPSREDSIPERMHDLPIPEDWSAMFSAETPDGIDSKYLTEEFELEQNVEENCFQDESDVVCQKTSAPVLQSASFVTGESATGLDAFVRGLGISRNMVPAETDEQWWYELGVSMQHLMTGLMESLHQRSAFKQSSRLNQTLFKRQENNPLKFSATLEDAIHNLFSRNSASFLPADQAITEAFADIEKHEKALLAGVVGAVGGIMNTLSPESIAEKTSERQFWQRLSPSSSNLKNWAAYEAMYRRLEQDLEGSNSVFYWDDFVKAYEASSKGIK